MRGEIVSYDAGVDSGLVRGADGAQYRFRRADLIEFAPPGVGAQVEFVARGEAACEIAIIAEATPETRDIWGYFLKCMAKSFDAKGRARRLEYWSFVLLSMFFVFLASYFIKGIGVVGWFYAGEAFRVSFAQREDLIVLGVTMLFVPAHLTAIVRRLHDIGMNGWWALLILFPISWVFLVICELIPSARGTNKYGPYPKLIKQKPNRGNV